MKSLTLIIPTHNRQNYLPRSISYYSNVDFSVVYCDSTVNAYDFKGADNIRYLHLPDFTFSQKILHVLEKINTSFVALCADDDFVFISSLTTGYELMNENSNVTTVIGNIIQFHEKFDDTFFSTKIYDSTNFNSSPTKNVEVFLSNYRQVLWGIYKIEILLASFNILNKAKFSNDNFFELVISVLSAYNGEIKFLKKVWSARELSTLNHWATRHQSLFYYMTSKSIQDDIKNFIVLIDKNTEPGIGRLAINSYLKSSFLIKTKFLIKGVIKNYLKFSFLNYLRNSNYSIYINYNSKNQDIIEISSLLQENKHV